MTTWRLSARNYKEWLKKYAQAHGTTFKKLFDSVYPGESSDRDFLNDLHESLNTIPRIDWGGGLKECRAKDIVEHIVSEHQGEKHVTIEFDRPNIKSTTFDSSGNITIVGHNSKGDKTILLINVDAFFQEEPTHTDTMHIPFSIRYEKNTSDEYYWDF